MNAIRSVLIVFLVLVLVIAALCLAVMSKTPLTGGTEAASVAIDDFPYWSQSLPAPHVMFEALKQPLRTTPQGNILIRTYPGDYRRSDALSNYFTESARIDCRAGGFPTPREAWDKLRKKGLARGKTPEEQRELVYGATRECNIFNPAFARWVIEKTAGRNARVIDGSAGWGDRLIGAMAADAECYHGYDPNPWLQTGYRAIIEEFRGRDHKDFWVDEEPFEGAEVKANFYDVALTSPPYFSYEIYVPKCLKQHEAQSTSRWPTYEEWTEHMYEPYLRNMYSAVRPGGWILIYVEDVRIDKRKYPLRQLTRKIMQKLGARSAGRFGLQVRSSDGSKSTKKKYRQKQAKTRWALAWRKP